MFTTSSSSHNKSRIFLIVLGLLTLVVLTWTGFISYNQLRKNEEPSTFLVLQERLLKERQQRIDDIETRLTKEEARLAKDETKLLEERRRLDEERKRIDLTEKRISSQQKELKEKEKELQDLRKALLSSPSPLPIPSPSSNRHRRREHLPDWMGTFKTDTPELASRREAVRDAMIHVWDGYRKYAWGFDELKPLHKEGVNNWGGFAVQILDALDTLLIMDMVDEFEEAKKYVATIYWRKAVEVSFFETVIRSLGGLLSAFELSRDIVFLQKASELGDILEENFDSKGYPLKEAYMGPNSIFGKKVKRYPWSYSRDRVLAEIGTIQLEFAYLGYYTNRPDLMAKTDAIIKNVNKWPRPFSDAKSIWPYNVVPSTRSFSGTVTWGGSADSFYEYLLKRWILTGKQDSLFRKMYDDSVKDFEKYLVRQIWVVPPTDPSKKVPIGLAGEIFPYFNAYESATTYHAVMEHLTCFAPGLLALGARGERKQRDLALAKTILDGCIAMYMVTPTGISPERMRFNIDENNPFVSRSPSPPRKKLKATKASPSINSPGSHLLSEAERKRLEKQNSRPQRFPSDIDEQEKEERREGEAGEGEVAEAVLPKRKILEADGKPTMVNFKKPSELNKQKSLLEEQEEAEREREREKEREANLWNPHDVQEASTASDSDSQWNGYHTKRNDREEHDWSSNPSSHPAFSSSFRSKTTSLAKNLGFIPPLDLSQSINWKEEGEWIVNAIKQPLESGYSLMTVESDGSLLRPETIESLFILYRFTKDEQYREIGWIIFQNYLKHCKTKYGFSGLMTVSQDDPAWKTGKLETFFMAETMKYFYLLFTPDDFLPLDKYVFNTEAHPLGVFDPDVDHGIELWKKLPVDLSDEIGVLPSLVEDGQEKEGLYYER